MQGIVMEILGGKAVVMNGSGDFIQVRNRNYTVGQQLKQNAHPATKPYRLAMAAAAALLVILSGGIYAYCTPYAQMNVDVNPSIGMDLNVFNRIVAAYAYNEDAQKILTQLRLKNASVDTATRQMVEELVRQGYLADDGTILITTTSRDTVRSQVMLQAAIQTTEQAAANLQIRATVLGECLNNEVTARARTYGVSPGKLLLAEQYANTAGDQGNAAILDAVNLPVQTLANGIRSHGEEPAGTQEQPTPTGKEGSGGEYRWKAQNGAGNTASISPSANTTAAQNQYGNTDGDKKGNGLCAGTTPAPTPTPATTPTPAATPTTAASAPPVGAYQPDTTCPSPCPTCTGDENQYRHGNGGK